MRTIKKYSNRRLYDTAESRYVNLDDLAAMIRAGERLQVLDAATEADLTRAVLVQVLLESPEGAAFFPPGLLHRIIRYSGELPWQRAAIRQLGQAMELLDAQAQQIEKLMGWPAPTSADGPRRASSTRAPDTEPAPPPEPEPAAGTAAGTSSASPPPPSASGPDVDELRARLAALEARLQR